MKKLYFLGLLSAMLIITACSDHKNEKTKTDSQKEHHEMQENIKGKHHSHSANEYMHKKPVEELIENFESPERDSYQHPEKVLDYLGAISNKTIMDIGAGSGYFSVKLANKGAHVIAADVSDDFQNALKKRIEDNNLKNITLRKIPYDSPNLENEEVDMVLIVNTYHHIENRSDYFSKVKNGIKEDGELVIVDFFKSEVPVGPPIDHKISIDQVISELKDAGYSQFEVNVDLLPYQYIIKAIKSNKVQAFWNNRYKQDEFAYGKSPNEYLKQKIKTLQPKGKILFPAEGEGRNAVYAATLGWDVDAFDISLEGKNKALQLAKENNVSIDYKVGYLPELDYDSEQFDAIALIYAHFPADIKAEYLKLLSKKLKKGGLVIFEAFSKNHIEYRKKNPEVGGPASLDVLYNTDEIKSYFKNFEILELEEKEIELNEGLYHNGKGSVIRFVGRK